MDDTHNALQNLVHNVLGVKDGEQVAVLHDTHYQAIAQLIRSYCSSASLHASCVEGDYSAGMPMPSSLSDAFKSRNNQVIICGFRDNIWHSQERRNAKHNLNKRLVNLLYSESPCTSCTAPVHAIQARSNALHCLLAKGQSVRILSDKGTDLRAEIGTHEKSIFNENGDYTRERSGGDFPSGEVGFGPKPGSVNGRIVFDLKIQYVGITNHKPLTIHIKNDAVEMNMLNSALEKRYLTYISQHPILKFLSEISIGTNPVSVHSDDIQNIVEEKNLGTCHFGNGANESYGAPIAIRKGPHFDGVIDRPTIFVDNTCIMDHGRPQGW